MFSNSHTGPSAKGRNINKLRCIRTASDQSLADHQAMVNPRKPELKIKMGIKTNTE